MKILLDSSSTFHFKDFGDHLSMSIAIALVNLYLIFIV